ncbi:hypothetical protein [Plesiocystis pacifica]|uniref:hypothetical protein n=1 Tax=Plesiocystis pacifica TaxID=191768 RepID=UPI0012F98299|nr:hypothetical protein [Plesiocystis pacifica]
MLERVKYLPLALILVACPADDGGDDEVGETAGDDTSESDSTTEDGTDTTTEDTTDAETTEDTTADAETETDTGAPMIDCDVDAWDIAMDTQWKSAWMAACMVPTIAPIMQGIDPVLYENFSCADCHGDDLGGGTFAMPATTPISFADAANWDPAYIDGMTFMGPMAEVADTAAATLGYEPFSMDNPDGFGCGGCHVIEG